MPAHKLCTRANIYDRAAFLLDDFFDFHADWFVGEMATKMPGPKKLNKEDFRSAILVLRDLVARQRTSASYFDCLDVLILNGKYNGQNPTMLVNVKIPQRTRSTIPNVPSTTPVKNKNAITAAIITLMIRSAIPMFFCITLVLIMQISGERFPRTVTFVTQVVEM